MEKYHEAMLLIADNFTWTDVEFKVKYWSALATICNVWRSTGIPKKLKQAVESLYGPVVAKRIVGNLPGRPVRQRWGACQSCQKRIDEGGDILAEAFSDRRQEQGGAEAREACETSSW